MLTLTETCNIPTMKYEAVQATSEFIHDFGRLSGHTTGEVIAGMSYGIRVVYVHLDELVYFIFELVSAT